MTINEIHIKNEESLSIVFKNNKPFPNIVLDNFLDEDLAEVLADIFPSPTPKWYHYDNPLEKKYATDRSHLIPNFFNTVLRNLRSPNTLCFLEKLTGIEGLIPDPYLRGGGLHAIEPGGFLGIHSDYPIHPKLKLYRRVNLLIYLNKLWQKSWGGDLELWNKDMTECQAKISPLLNRAVIFQTNPDSFHGHPDPTTSPNGVYRNSIALYYYTFDKPEGYDVIQKSTCFKRRPSDPVDPKLDELREIRSKGRIGKDV